MFSEYKHISIFARQLPPDLPDITSCPHTMELYGLCPSPCPHLLTAASLGEHPQGIFDSYQAGEHDHTGLPTVSSQHTGRWIKLSIPKPQGKLWISGMACCINYNHPLDFIVEKRGGGSEDSNLASLFESWIQLNESKDSLLSHPLHSVHSLVVKEALLLLFAC